MDNPRPEKVAVVEEVRGRLSSSNATILTEYRGLKVGELAQLRRSVRQAGATTASTRTRSCASRCVTSASTGSRSC